MQLAPISATTPTLAAPAAPSFEGGIEHEGTGRFRRFSATATDHVYGETDGYGSLRQAIDAVTLLTVGARQAAAGIFERDGRFHARRLENEVTFANGATWKGLWRLEQFPADLALLDGTTPGTTTRAPELRAVVDGAQRVVVEHLPAAGAR